MPTCYFRLSVIVAITWRHYIRARHGRKSRTCRWNFDAICCSSGGITTSGFGRHIAISGCRSMLRSNDDPFCEFVLVENPRFAIGIAIISVILSETQVVPVWMVMHIAISGCPSMSHSFVNTFFEFVVIQNCFSCYSNTYFRFFRLCESGIMTMSSR